MNDKEDSKVKDEILEKIILAMSKKGLNNLSLRDIAKEIGTSGRMILYYFKSYDLLINSVFIYLSTKHKDTLKKVFSENRKVLLLFLELYTKAARDPGKYKLFFKEVLYNWITEIETTISSEYKQNSKYYSAMIISFYRGLLMDWLASNDTDRIYETNKAFIELISGIMKDHRTEYTKEKNNDKQNRRKRRNEEHSK